MNAWASIVNGLLAATTGAPKCEHCCGPMPRKRARFCCAACHIAHQAIDRPTNITKTTCTCTKCGKVSPPSEHYVQRDKRQNPRMSSWCKDCHRAYMVEYKKRKRGEK